MEKEFKNELSQTWPLLQNKDKTKLVSHFGEEKKNVKKKREEEKKKKKKRRIKRRNRRSQERYGNHGFVWNCCMECYDFVWRCMET